MPCKAVNHGLFQNQNKPNLVFILVYFDIRKLQD